MKDPIAVIMAVYGKDDPAKFKDSIASVIKSHLTPYRPIHIYLVIDGEIPENLEATITKNTSNFYKVIRRSQNGGLGAALNDAIRSLENEKFVFRMDADDRCFPQRFQRQIDYLTTNPSISICGTYIIEVDERSGHEQTIKFSATEIEKHGFFLSRVPVAHPTVCFRREVFDKVPAYPTVRNNEDVSMWFSCIKAGLHFGNVPEPLLYFSISEDFWKRRGVNKAISEWRCYTRGLIDLKAPKVTLIIPTLRLAFRLLPTFLSQLLYRSPLRR